MYGNRDVEADISDRARFEKLALDLPDNALWITSDLMRTHQTADAVAACGLTASSREQTPLIREMDFGDATGMSHRDLVAQRTDPYVGFWPISPVDDAPSGESMQQLCQRVEQFMSDCIVRHPEKDIICYSHMGPILAALTISLSLDLHNSVAFHIDNLSITQIHHFAQLDEKAPEYRVMKVSAL